MYTKSFIQLIRFLLLAALSFVPMSCLNSPESVYERMLDKYADKREGNITLMAEKFLIAFSEFNVKYDELFFNKSVILTINGDRINLLYPEKEKISGDRSIGGNVTFADMNKHLIILGNGTGFCVFDDDGDPQTIYKPEKKERIDAVAIKGKNIIYLSEGRVFEMSPADKKIARTDPGEYHPSYRKFFRSTLTVSEKFTVLATGIAGSYYLSVFDNITGRSVMKNITSSSTELIMTENDLIYVRGGTGSWSIEKYEIQSKKRSQVKSVGKIDNIFIAVDGFITISGKKYYIESFSGEKGVMPGDWNIIGACRNIVLVEYGKTVYMMEFPLLLKKIREMNEKMGE